jgi:hypothetical protein
VSEQNSIVVGKYTLSGAPEDMVGAECERHAIWIEHESGEGMAVSDKDLEEVIERYWEKNF